ncbi:helix-turn-helix domain-containing protein [Paenibacillus harenae]|uniref:AraC-like DNA-binding protein n=1 Tax=Paenibacillus harenae TaxID=306543 RepID=A0ABT9U321_PAEHA|nr:AraC family transcriptional regulator [Paenibacillus harenae]MDQ0059225.1 AraC-like DNA-binding protein [Paenibacillus harenae]MDQ0112689.1 AraC-like DNA-binding protein [Paenibacillus harenae]
MTYFPDYLKTYPNMDTSSPLHISLNRLNSGFRPHRHDFLEFSFVVDGVGAEAINDVTHIMKPGTFTFVLPYQVHELFTEQGSTLVLYNCNFSMDLLMGPGRDESLIDFIEQLTLPSFVQLDGQANGKMASLIEEMYAEYRSSKPWRLTLLQLKLKEILIHFDRERRKAAPIPEDAQPASKRSNAVWPIIHHIHLHYHEDLSLADLSAKFSMSISRISEVIKQTTGQTFVHFLHDLRLRHACSLLVSTEMSVSEIALEVGYGSYKTFSRIFHEKKGVVPKEYRKTKLNQP